MQLNDSVVRTNGRIDVAASLEALEVALNDAITAEVTAFEAVSGAVLAVFEEHKGAALPKPAVVSYTMNKLNTSPADYKATAELINAYIDQNKDGDDSLFSIKKGKGGGVSFRAHATPAAK